MRVRMKKGRRPISIGITIVPAYPEFFEVPPEFQAGVELLLADGQLERAPYNEARNADGTLAPADPAQRPPEGFRYPRSTRKNRPCKPLEDTPGGTAASMTQKGPGGRFQRKAGV